MNWKVILSVYFLWPGFESIAQYTEVYPTDQAPLDTSLLYPEDSKSPVHIQASKVNGNLELTSLEVILESSNETNTMEVDSRPSEEGPSIEDISSGSYYNSESQSASLLNEEETTLGEEEIVETSTDAFDGIDMTNDSFTSGDVAIDEGHGVVVPESEVTLRGLNDSNGDERDPFIELGDQESLFFGPDTETDEPIFQLSDPTEKNFFGTTNDLQQTETTTDLVLPLAFYDSDTNVDTLNYDNEGRVGLEKSRNDEEVEEDNGEIYENNSASHVLEPSSEKYVNDNQNNDKSNWIEIVNILSSMLDENREETTTEYKDINEETTSVIYVVDSSQAPEVATDNLAVNIEEEKSFWLNFQTVENDKIVPSSERDEYIESSIIRNLQFNEDMLLTTTSTDHTPTEVTTEITDYDNIDENVSTDDIDLEEKIYISTEATVLIDEPTETQLQQLTESSTETDQLYKITNGETAEEIIDSNGYDDESDLSVESINEESSAMMRPVHIIESLESTTTQTDKPSSTEDTDVITKVPQIEETTVYLTTDENYSLSKTTAISPMYQSGESNTYVDNPDENKSTENITSSPMSIEISSTLIEDKTDNSKLVEVVYQSEPSSTDEDSELDNSQSLSIVSVETEELNAEDNVSEDLELDDSQSLSIVSVETEEQNTEESAEVVFRYFPEKHIEETSEENIVTTISSIENNTKVDEDKADIVTESQSTGFNEGAEESERSSIPVYTNIWSDLFKESEEETTTDEADILDVEMTEVPTEVFDEAEWNSYFFSLFTRQVEEHTERSTDSEEDTSIQTIYTSTLNAEVNTEVNTERTAIVEKNSAEETTMENIAVSTWTVEVNTKLDEIDGIPDDSLNDSDSSSTSEEVEQFEGGSVETKKNNSSDISVGAEENTTADDDLFNDEVTDTTYVVSNEYSSSGSQKEEDTNTERIRESTTNGNKEENGSGTVNSEDDNGNKSLDVSEVTEEHTADVATLAQFTETSEESNSGNVDEETITAGNFEDDKTELVLTTPNLIYTSTGSEIETEISSSKVYVLEKGFVDSEMFHALKTSTSEAMTSDEEVPEDEDEDEDEDEGEAEEEAEEDETYDTGYISSESQSGSFSKYDDEWVTTDNDADAVQMQFSGENDDVKDTFINVIQETPDTLKGNGSGINGDVLDDAVRHILSDLLNIFSTDSDSTKENGTDDGTLSIPYIQGTVFGSEANFSIQIMTKNQTMYVPPTAYLLQDPTIYTLNITWHSPSEGLNNSLWLSMVSVSRHLVIHEVQMRIVEDGVMSVWGKKSIVMPKVTSTADYSREIEFEEGTKVFIFSSEDFLQTPEETDDKLTTNNSIEESYTEIALGATVSSLVVVSIIFAFVVKGWRRAQRRKFKPEYAV